MVMTLHGYGTSATGVAIETTTGFNHYAERKDFIAVYPQGSHFVTKKENGEEDFVSSWNDLAGNKSSSPEGPMCTADSHKYPCPPECGECGKCHWTSCYDDLGFIRNLLEEIKMEFTSDVKRHYLIGVSNGAMMAQRLACEFDGEFAAVALTIGRLERGYSCTPSSPMALLQLNGGLDTTVPPDGGPSADGFYYTPSREVSKSWARQAQCSSTVQRWSNKITLEQGLLCNMYSDCNDKQVEVIDCLWPEGKHVWPGNIGGGGWCVNETQKESVPTLPLCKTISKESRIWGSDLIWNFFSQHKRN